MKITDQIEIPLSKIKLTLMLTGSIAFVVAGCWFVIKRPVSPLPVLDNPMVVFVAGLASILFFGLCAVMITGKLTENISGLIINDEGITDNSGGVSAGLVLWKDIREIRKTNVANQAFIIIIVNNPKDYIARQTGFIKRKFMELNYKSYDSPITISSNGLKCDFNELYLTISRELESKKNSAPLTQI